MAKRMRSVPVDEYAGRYDPEAGDVVRDQKEGPGWFPLLLIPLLILGGALILPNLTNNSDRTNEAGDNLGNPSVGRPEVGVGGGPDESPTISVTVTPTGTPTPTLIPPTLSPTIGAGDMVD